MSITIQRPINDNRPGVAAEFLRIPEAFLKVYSQELLDPQVGTDIKAIRSLYGRIGYIKANVHIARTFSEKEPKVTLRSAFLAVLEEYAQVRDEHAYLQRYTPAMREGYAILRSAETKRRKGK